MKIKTLPTNPTPNRLSQLNFHLPVLENKKVTKPKFFCLKIGYK